MFQTGTNSASRYFSYAGLGIGVLLLLCSIQMFINIQQLLGVNTIRKNGYDFVSITRKITNESMGQPEKNLFSQKEIDDLRSKPFIEAAAPLVSNQFRVQLGAGAIISFRTDLFLESINDDFIDTVPPAFKWQEGQMNIPVIISSDFLEAYNVFAPGQGLPQLSQETAMNLPLMITCSGNGKEINFRGSIVAFSDRINSVLVPESFLIWSNQMFGNSSQNRPSRIFIKTKDANNPALLNYIDQHNYNINKDKTKFGRTKQVIQGIFSGLGIFGLLVVIMALMLFSFYLQLVIARSKESLQLLLLLGYSPKWLSKNVSRQFIPVYIFIVIAALIVTQLIQLSFHHFVLFDRPELSNIISWIVIIVGASLIVLSILINYTLVRKLIIKTSY